MRASAMFLLVVGAFLLVACGASDERETPPETAPVPQEEPVEEEEVPETEPPEERAETSEQRISEARLKVQVWEDTAANPPGERAEIWVRGEGSWFPDLSFGGDTRTLGPFPVGEPQPLFFYPDGRDGAEVEVVFTMTSEMNPEGSDRDALNIEIRDAEVRVLAPGGSEQRFPR